MGEFIVEMNLACVLRSPKSREEEGGRGQRGLSRAQISPFHTRPLERLPRRTTVIVCLDGWSVCFAVFIHRQTNRRSDELPSFAQFRPRRMTCLYHNFGQRSLNDVTFTPNVTCFPIYKLTMYGISYKRKVHRLRWTTSKSRVKHSPLVPGSKLLANYQLGAAMLLLDSPTTLQICAFAKFDYANNLCYMVRISENWYKLWWTLGWNFLLSSRK